MLSRTFDVTLSFCGKDRNSAYDLAHELTRLGLTVFYDEWFESDSSTGVDDEPPSDMNLTSTVLVPLISKPDVTSPDRNSHIQAAPANRQSDNGGRVFPIDLGRSLFTGDLAKQIEDRVGLLAGQVGAVDPGPRETENHHVVLEAFTPAPPQKSVELARYGIVHLMKQCAEASDPAVRLRGAVEVAKSLFAEHEFRIGWPYDIWQWNGSIYLSALPDFSSPHRTLEFVLDTDGSRARLKAVWTSTDARYGKVDSPTATFGSHAHRRSRRPVSRAGGHPSLDGTGGYRVRVSCDRRRAGTEAAVRLDRAAPAL